ncbi:hypothetical protein JTB14_010219 [Gonioctena quinquepunctata]|nr:hypothetical protein JTB14_010219 [Gonioctena quinquepunctata]
MKISLVLLAGFCSLAITSGHLDVGGHIGAHADIPGFGAGIHAKLGYGLGHEKHHDVEVDHEVPEHIKKMFLIKADKTTLERQKKVLELLYHINQDSQLAEHIEIAKKYSPFSAHATSLYLEDNVVEKFHKYWKYGLLAKGAVFSIFDADHMHQAVALIKMLYHAKDFDVFYKTAVWARMNVNEGMFVYSLYVAVVHRADTKGIMLPSIHEVTPHMFFGVDVINKAQYFKQVHETQQREERGGYTIDSNYSYHHMNMNHEQTSLAYYLEDVGSNVFFYNLHIRFPFWMNSTEFGWNNVLRGSFIGLAHQALWARYHLERISHGYDDMEYLDWDLPVETPYHSNLVYPNGVPFPNRPKFAKLHEYFYNYGQTNWANSIGAHSHTRVKNIERRLVDSIEGGAVLNTEGKVVKIGSDEFVDVIGNLIECNYDSPNRQYYGPIWHYARQLLGYSTQPLNESERYPSALEHFETTMRDPAFYRLIQKLVVEPFQRHIYRLPPYTKKELMFEGVEVTRVEVGPLVTFFDSFYSSLINSVFYKPGELNEDFSVSVRQARLNHAPFDYKIHVKSNKPQKASIKIMMSPKYDRNGKPIEISRNLLYFVELDNFVADLHAGDNVVSRRSSDSLLFTPDKMSYGDLWNSTLVALNGKKEFITDLRQNWYGFPQRLMIPKGSVGGTPYQIFFAVYPYIESQRHQTHDMVQVDNYPMNYPLDRFIKFDRMWDHIPNFHFEEVKVYFREDEDSW